MELATLFGIILGIGGIIVGNHFDGGDIASLGQFCGPRHCAVGNFRRDACRKLGCKRETCPQDVLASVPKTKRVGKSFGQRDLGKRPAGKTGNNFIARTQTAVDPRSIFQKRHEIGHRRS